VSDPPASADQSTLLVPSNKAVLALGWKPERGPPSQQGGENEIEITEETLEGNVEKWVRSHVVPAEDLDFTSTKPQWTLRGGKSITLERREHGTSGEEEWKNYGIVQGSDFIPLKSRIEASNGVLYLIDGTISFD